MLNWHRAAFRRSLRGGTANASITAPTLGLWGARDVVLSRQMAVPDTVTRPLLDPLGRA